MCITFVFNKIIFKYFWFALLYLYETAHEAACMWAKIALARILQWFHQQYYWPSLGRSPIHFHDSVAISITGLFKKGRPHNSCYRVAMIIRQGSRDSLFSFVAVSADSKEVVTHILLWLLWRGPCDPLSIRVAWLCERGRWRVKSVASKYPPKRVTGTPFFLSV